MLDMKVELYESLLAECLAPRLTAVITTIDTKGRVNAAPYSFFMPLSYVPPRVCFSVNPRKYSEFASFHLSEDEPKASEVLKLKAYAGDSLDSHKDTLANVMEQGEFGVNILSIENLPQVGITDGAFPHGVNEMEMAGLTTYPSTKIKPPLIKEAKFGLECVNIAVDHIDQGECWLSLVIGEGVAAHLDSDVLEGEKIKPERFHSILQFAGPLFGVCTDFHYYERSRYGKVIGILKDKGY